MRKLFILLVLLSLSSFLYSEGITDLIDCPTANVVEYGGYDLNFRLYQPKDEGENGFLTRLFFGVLPHINLGIFFDTQNLIGKGNIKLRRPRMYFKFQLFSSQIENYIPAVAFGYEDQGYGAYTDGNYEQREKGIYLVVSQPSLIPAGQVHVGINLYEFDDPFVRGFVGVSLPLGDEFIPLFEYDNLGEGSESRLNIGVRYQIVPNLHIEIAGRDIVNTTERILRIEYKGNF